MHLQVELGVARQVARPANDEILGGRVEVALPERRGVERVEELRQRAELQPDPFAGAVSPSFSTTGIESFIPAVSFSKSRSGL